MRKFLIALLVAIVAVPAAHASGSREPGKRDTDKKETVRFATFNASLNRSAAGQLVSDLSTPANTQAWNVAETIQRVRPDVVLVNEFDYDAAGGIGGPDDAFGFGFYPGQFGMATFKKLLWRDMPARLPDDPATAAPADWYSPAE